MDSDAEKHVEDRERVQAGARLSQMSIEEQKAVDEAQRLKKEILEVQDRLDAALNDRLTAAILCHVQKFKAS